MKKPSKFRQGLPNIVVGCIMLLVAVARVAIHADGFLWNILFGVIGIYIIVYPFLKRMLRIPFGFILLLTGGIIIISGPDGPYGGIPLALIGISVMVYPLLKPRKKIKVDNILTNPKLRCLIGGSAILLIAGVRAFIQDSYFWNVCWGMLGVFIMVYPFFAIASRTVIKKWIGYTLKTVFLAFGILLICLGSPRFLQACSRHQNYSADDPWANPTDQEIHENLKSSIEGIKGFCLIVVGGIICWGVISSEKTKKKTSPKKTGSNTVNGLLQHSFGGISIKVFLL